MLSERIAVAYYPHGTPAPDSPLAQRSRVWQLMIQSSTFADALTRVIQHYCMQQPTVSQRHLLRARLQELREYQVRVCDELVASYTLVPEQTVIASDVPHVAQKYLLLKDQHELYVFSYDIDAVSDLRDAVCKCMCNRVV